MALSRFDIGFTLSHNQKEVLTLKPAANDIAQEQRIAGIAVRLLLKIRKNRLLQHQACNKQVG